MFGFSIKSLLLLIILALFLIPYYNILSESYYVATYGSDSNPGTLQLPWQKLSYAITQTGAGDTIIMRGGIHVTNEVWIRGDHGQGGSNGQYLTIKNYPGEIASVGGIRRIIVDGANYVRIEGLSFRLPYRISGGGIGFQVLNNRFFGMQPSFGAIEFFADSGLIEGNIIEITGGGDTQDHGIYLHAGHNNIIRNNTITGPSGYGIHVYDAVSSGGGHASIGYDSILIENNVILNSRERAGIIVAHSNELEAKNFQIQKNIIAINATNGITLRSFSHNILIFNNTIYGNGWSASSPDGSSAISIQDVEVHDITIKNNIIEMSNSAGYHIQNREGSSGLIVERNLYWGTGSPKLFDVIDPSPLYGNPLFVDPSNNNFHLQANSPAIDAGIYVGLPYCGSAPDLGAYENGLENVLIEPPFLDFGEVIIGQSSLDSIKITNLGTENLEITAMPLTGTDSSEFNIDDIVPFSLSPGSFQSMLITFLPNSMGPKSSILQIETDDSLGSPINILLTGSGTKATNGGSSSDDIPTEFELHQNYPNPFNPETHIMYAIPIHSFVNITIYDLRGRRIVELVDETKAPGNYIEVWPGRNSTGINVATGMYVCRMRASAMGSNEFFSRSIKILLLR